MITAIDIEAELKADNPRATAVMIRLYADTLRIYVEAADNIAKNGAVCAHPRTGAPLENPYLKIRAAQAALLSKYRTINGDRVLAMLDEQHGNAE